MLASACKSIAGNVPGLAEMGLMVFAQQRLLNLAHRVSLQFEQPLSQTCAPIPADLRNQSCTTVSGGAVLRSFLGQPECGRFHRSRAATAWIRPFAEEARCRRIDIKLIGKCIGAPDQVRHR